MALPENENGEERQGPVIRDKRRIDPETGELRTPEGAQGTGPGAPEGPAPAEPEAEPVIGDPVADDGALLKAREQVVELTNDLKRVQAEYANYRKRVDRDRVVVREQAMAQVVGELLPIIDDIGRAREHGELTGGFKSVGEALEGLVGKLGLKRYGEKGDEFDPNVHEALTMVPSADVTVPTVIEVFQPGYLIGERVLRPARVVVAGPGEDAAADDAAPAEAGEPPASAEAPGEPGADGAAGPDPKDGTGDGT
ncbi:nucleotide exchange factor GrpE [Streptomonospora nanhaiensis]|uniref:Protein GrpE n=1 Tax=Streptomonospora nanhaiensis TaxID=1323731 RepID=A0A853BPS5_9ACTN|nr:nucleotide exchange factor GrpE [Streptomonospora nanhaiensis]MBV2365134.1 nucleotide exchange factor GrpE [Streptomonospora nanhaiensis]MBX9387780.1 nucleotide exchange factor GrpE [Streptomonospora nanhaiensis]NYI96656.1 molecular chaperone GrpE [Streptomonospora nanhaiensis]